ncbi:hypothetical protein OAG71_03250, partial [bacterium]|nr:hypothetical protein [bacterium]
TYVRRHGVLGNKAAAGFATGVSKKSSHALGPHDKKAISTFGIAAHQLTFVRQWLNERSWRERLAELIGSLLIAALACIVLNLIPFSLPASTLGNLSTAESNATEPIVEFWGRYAFATSVSVCACWIILASGKIWEANQGEAWLRRGVMALLGLVIGIAGWTAADFFGITLSLQNETASNEFTDFQISGVPVIPAYLIFFIVLFGCLRWWYQVDPVRKSRLSLWTVGLCFVWAVVFSHVLGASPIAHGLFAIIVSTSLQLAAPWMGEGMRKNIFAATDR